MIRHTVAFRLVHPSGSPAEQAGLMKGDVIEEIGGRTVESVPDASYNINLNLGEETEVIEAVPCRSCAKEAR